MHKEYIYRETVVLRLWGLITIYNLGRVRLGYSGIKIYFGMYSGYSAPGSRIAGMENPSIPE